MARRTIFLHVGLPGHGLTELDHTLRRHEDTLLVQGVRLPATSTREAHRAATEIRRTHRQAGYRRRDVEGTWAAICRRAFKHKGTSLVVQEDLAAAAPNEIALLLDGLAGFRVEVVVTAEPSPDVAHELTSMLAAWSPYLHPGRLHVISAAGTPNEAVTRLGNLVGFQVAGHAGGAVSAAARRPRRLYAS